MSLMDKFPLHSNVVASSDKTLHDINRIKSLLIGIDMTEGRCGQEIAELKHAATIISDVQNNIRVMKRYSEQRAEIR